MSFVEGVTNVVNFSDIGEWILFYGFTNLLVNML